MPRIKILLPGQVPAHGEPPVADVTHHVIEGWFIPVEEVQMGIEFCYMLRYLVKCLKIIYEKVCIHTFYIELVSLPFTSKTIRI